MVFTAVLLMTLAVALGIFLALWHLRADEQLSARPPVVIGVVHGTAGAVGLAVLLVALWGPARGVAAGAGSFGALAAWLFAAAVVIGLAVLVPRRGTAAIALAIHAGLAVTGYLLLLAWDYLG